MKVVIFILASIVAASVILHALATSIPAYAAQEVKLIQDSTAASSSTSTGANQTPQ